MDGTTRVEADECPSHKRVDMPSCAWHDWGYKFDQGFWYTVKSSCVDDIKVNIDIRHHADKKIRVRPGKHHHENWLHGAVRTIKCCTDTWDANCYTEASEAEPDNRDLHPMFPFRVEIGDGLRGYGTDPNDPPWTASLACHSLDLNRWIDGAIDPWEKVWCDARYNAYISVHFKPTGTTTKETIDPPYNNPCDSGGPLYEITQGADEGLTFGTDLGHERIGCE